MRVTLFAFLVGLALLDAAIVAALEIGMPEVYPEFVSRAEPQAFAEEENQPIPRDEGFSFCQTRYAESDVTPSKVAISYLDANVDRSVTEAEIRSWFGSGADALLPHAVDVYALEHKNGRRRIAFEVAAGKWAGWAKAASGSSGREVCARVRAALLEAKIGRPDPGGDTDRSRYDFDFVYARRTKLWLNYTFLGTLDQFLKPGLLTDYRSWLDEGVLK
jgi:hypothetical protein